MQVTTVTHFGKYTNASCLNILQEMTVRANQYLYLMGKKYKGKVLWPLQEKWTMNGHSKKVIGWWGQTHLCDSLSRPFKPWQWLEQHLDWSHTVPFTVHCARHVLDLIWFSGGGQWLGREKSNHNWNTLSTHQCYTRETMMKGNQVTPLIQSVKLIKHHRKFIQANWIQYSIHIKTADYNKLICYFQAV